MRTTADVPVAPSHTIKVLGCENDAGLAASIETLLLPILLRARVKTGEYKFRVKTRHPSDADPAVSFRHDGRDIVYYHHVLITNQPGISGQLDGLLCIPPGAERSQLVDDLNAAVTGTTYHPTNQHDEEIDMAKRDKQAAQSGRKIIVRKSRTVNVSLPHLINRVLDSLLDEANLPPGQYELVIDAVTSPPQATASFWLGVSPTLQKGVYRLTMQLSQENQQTFVGNLTLSSKVVASGTITPKLLEAAAVVNQERSESTRKRPAKRADDHPSAAAAHPPTVASQPPTPAAVTPSPQATQPTLHEQAERIMAGLRTCRQTATEGLQRLEHELAAKIADLQASYDKFRQPLLNEITTIDSSLAEMQRHIEWLSKRR